ncbi:MAG: hypothetical protein RJA09_666, partial [Pseudomonadota bacterium]
MHTPALWPGLLWAVAALVGVPGTAGAATDAEIKLIVDGVKSRYASFDTYCKQPDDDRRKATMQVTMELAMAR